MTSDSTMQTMPGRAAITVKLALLDDLADVAELFDRYRGILQTAIRLGISAFFLAGRLQKGDSVICLARDAGGQAVGFTQLYPTFSSQSMQRTWILNDLYVTKSQRKKGIASCLHEAARQFSKGGDAKGLMLCTQLTNQRAQALYRKSGYKKLDEFEWYFLKT